MLNRKGPPSEIAYNAKIKLNDCRLHKAAQIYRSCNCSEVQNERAAVLFRSHSSKRNLADGSFPIGRPNNVD